MTQTHLPHRRVHVEMRISGIDVGGALALSFHPGLGPVQRA